MSVLTPDEIRNMRASSVLAGARMFWALADEIATLYDVSVADLKAKNRSAPAIVEARKQLCKAALARNISSVQIGKWLGGRDHSTVFKAAATAQTSLGVTDDVALVFQSRRG